MRHVRLLVITLALVVAALRVDAGPITFLTALPVAKSQIVVRGQYLFIRASSDPTPADQDLTVHALPFAVAVGVTSKSRRTRRPWISRPRCETDGRTDPARRT